MRQVLTIALAAGFTLCLTAAAFAAGPGQAGTGLRQGPGPQSQQRSMTRQAPTERPMDAAQLRDRQQLRDQQQLRDRQQLRERTGEHRPEEAGSRPAERPRGPRAMLPPSASDTAQSAVGSSGEGTETAGAVTATTSPAPADAQ